MENDEPQLHAVLDFLNRCGFSNAAYALRNEAVSRGFEIPDGRIAPGCGEVNTGLSFVKIAPGGGEVNTDENSMPLLLSPVRTTKVRIAPGGGEVNTDLGFSSSGDFGSIGLLPFVKIAPGGGEVNTGLASSSGDFSSIGSLPFELRNSYLLPPVKTSPGCGEVNPGLASSSSYSSGDFVSIGSSPFELRNPYGIWSPARTGSSSARNSEFGTAREYNESILFGDSGWYGDQFAGCFNDPYLLGSNHSEVKFGMSIEAEKFLKQEGSCFNHGVKQESCVGLGSAGVYGCSIPVCDFYKGNGEEKHGVDMMENNAEMLNGCEYNGVHLKRADGLDRGTKDRVLESLSGEKLKPSMDETSNLAFTDFVPEFMQNNDLTTVHFLENNNSEVLGNGDNDEKRLCWKTSELEANDGSECGIVDGDIKDSESLRAAGEDDDIPDDLQLFTAHEVELETFDLRIIHRKNRTGFEENKDLQIVLNSIVAGRYYLTDFLGSATFSKVVQARDLHTGTDVCLKIIKNDKDFFDQSLDEIKLLKYVNKSDPSDQCHLLRLYDYFYHKEHLFIVCELLRANLYEFQKFNQDLGGDIYFTLPRIQAIARQCLEALQYLHGLKVIHCDLKPENILIKSYSRCEIKIIDLGSSCFLTDNLRLYEQSRSYRAPEVILGVPYDEKIDIWSLGCILAELYTGEVLFLNDSLAMILARMIGILGPIDTAMLENGQEAHKYFTEDYELYLKNEETDTVEYLIPKKSSLAYSLQVSDAAFLDFLSHLLQLNPERRLTASQALRHGWLSVSYKSAPQVARSLASH